MKNKIKQYKFVRKEKNVLISNLRKSVGIVTTFCKIYDRKSCELSSSKHLKF